MKPLALCVLAAAAALVAARVSASPASDVPPGHWASASVKRLAAQKIMIGTAPCKFDGSKTVTRYELALALDRMVRYMEAGRKPLSPGTPLPAAKLPAGANAPTKQALSHLTQGGFLPPSSPLLQANKTVTAQELTVALSSVVIRLTDRSLPPTSH